MMTQPTGVEKREKEKEKGNERESEKEKENEKDNKKGRPFGVTKEDLWALQRVFNSRKGSLRVTYKKNTEANTKVHDLN